MKRKPMKRKSVEIKVERGLFDKVLQYMLEHKETRLFGQMFRAFEEALGSQFDKGKRTVAGWQRNVQHALDAAEGDVTKAAKMLGLSSASVRRITAHKPETRKVIHAKQAAQATKKREKVVPVRKKAVIRKKVA